jgi:beta-galactosidase
MKTQIKLLAAFVLAVGLNPLVAQTAVAALAGDISRMPRVRLLLDEGWRFQKDDPPGNTVPLLYDVRPDVSNATENQVADARPTELAKRDTTHQAVLKPWILPAGNAFIKDPARRHTRPAGDPGSEVAYVQAGFDDSSWRRVDLPHDWAIDGPFITQGDVGGVGRLPSWGVGWYRRKLEIPAADAGKVIVLEIDGAMSYATVWLNGHLVGGWPFGYSSWQLDLTPFVNFGGENQLAIRLDNPPRSSRWYPGGGLYRNVWLTKTQPVHIGQWGTQVLTREVSAASATIDLSVTIANDLRTAANVKVSTLIYALGNDGLKSGEALAAIKVEELAVAAQGSALAKGSVTLANPQLWGPPPTQSPHRYVAETTVSQEGRMIDSYETRFGIRSVVFDADRGLLVNGEHIPLRGANMHHDFGSLGAAFNLRAAERQLQVLLELGCNAIRTSHNPPAPELLELTDRMGFLVYDESFDCWELGKNPLDFHLIFTDWHEQDLRSLIRRDRNHPSVIIWSLGNEVGEQYTDVAGAEIGRRLNDIAHEEDSSRPTTSALNYAKPHMLLPAVLDVISVNYQGEGIRQDVEFDGMEHINKTPPQYDAFHKQFPQKAIFSSESASTFSTRGAYLFPVSKRSSAPVRDGLGGDPVNHFVTAYELHAADYSSATDKVFGSLDRHPYVAGEFVWTGWDHLGEPTPYYEARSAYSGIIDLAGFKKDRFYLYQAHWRPEFPMAHILPHWTWPERVGQITPVHVFTSGDEAELFLNGRSLGRKARGKYEYRLRWDDLVYEPGTLEVVAYRNGRKWATDTMRTAQDPAALEVTPDRTEIRADGRDLSFVTVRVTDVAGLTAPRANNPLSFAIEGPGEIVATDNGDQTSFEPFQAPRRKAFNGLCLVIVRAKIGQAGRITLTASSNGLKDGVTLITAAK